MWKTCSPTSASIPHGHGQQDLIVFLNFVAESLEGKKVCSVSASLEERCTKTAFKGFISNSEENDTNF